ncbi:hypothetical protein QCE73_38120 [Caballeronia sp. LZ029]|uniref:hypothetical protein n=1 Tax=Caballeronia sp. LZ029 TaxID=3038564 RepID=UPI00285FE458|nr:hypothetical protein [Caballeronia sp. LZ029]MDR5748980.1 hypothetical protein [Caballeronia sp. LZ029]
MPVFHDVDLPLMKRNHRAERRVHTIQRSQAPAHIAVLDINIAAADRFHLAAML